MKGKRFIVFIFIPLLVLTFSLLYAAGKEKAEKPTETGKPYAGTTLHVLMEDIVDTHSIEPYLPEFEEETGIRVIFEKMNYNDMHEKLVPQLMAGEGNGSYDFIEVDNYWVGEFVMAGWLRPIDDYLRETPEIKLENYIDAVVDMFTVGDKTYFIPMWSYPMGLLYRTDIANDPEFHSYYEKTTGKGWSFPPKDLYEYAEIAKAANDFTPDDIYGVAMQGAKIDPLVMELTNYVYAMGGDYFDRKRWEATFNSRECIEALKIYKDLIDNAAQPGATGAIFDDAIIVAQQGKAAFMLTYNFTMVYLMDEKHSTVYDRVAFMPLPGGGLQGGWAWAIPVSSPNPDAAWEYIKWVERPENQKRRAMGGAMPSAKWLYSDEEFLEKYPYQKGAGDMIAIDKAFPIISQSTRMIEIIGEFSSSALIGEISIEEAVEEANKDLDDIIKGDPLVEMQR
jgi:ABC-type glycerol-3-phosphate transport system substrate-binding protein